MQNQQKQEATNLFAEKEKKILNFWENSEIFNKSLAKDAPAGDFVFYDGPPFATGEPHYGHIVASIMKDAVPRYFAMRGFRVERKWGWDCHGLPVENLAEKELGLKDKQEIEKIGVVKFNEYCRSIVMRYAEEWKKTINRIGRWVDMENDYKTMDPNFMESVWWVFKTLWDKGLVYQGRKAMHICPRCGTTLSNFEVAQGYKDIKDLSVTAKFELLDEPGTFVLAWTTTPWTLIGNVALAVGSGIVYQKIKIQKAKIKIESQNLNFEKEEFILAKERVEEIFKNFEYEAVKEFTGDDLIGRRYQPLFDCFANDEKLEKRENGWRIYPADFVTTSDGTGVVHIAPAFGEDDMNLGNQFQLPFVQHVDGNGRFTKEVALWAGKEVKPKNDNMATDVEIVKHLASESLLFDKAKYEHSYPHCWRCDTPLLNYATSSWFVKVTAIRDELIKNNQKVRWVPDNIKDGRFGKWLEQARDWAVSRNRYWGTPLPVWICDSCGEKTVVGSRQELENLSGAKAEDLHKQFVDDIAWTCSCGGAKRRIPEVFDCWFESGSMPYGQEHYPFANKERFEKNFPANFIAEGLDQTRGWFYTMMVLATALFGREAAQNIIVNGIVMAEDGQKMSKRLKNYPDPAEIFEKYSVDAMRYYLLASPVLVAENLNFSEEGVREALRKVLMITANVYKFYELFADKTVSENQVNASDNILDQWIVVKLNQLIKEVTENLEAYNLPKAVRPIGDFVNDLSTWYIRRSRERFKSENEQDKASALATTSYVLKKLSLVMAPFMPFLAEDLWQKVTGFNFQNENQSVHLESWPALFEAEAEKLGVIEEMEMVKKIAELGLAERDKAGIKVRQPIASLKFKIKNSKFKINEIYFELIKDELNVKSVSQVDEGDLLEVEIDTNITPELKLEGAKRDIVRQINLMRKNAGLTIEDRIVLRWQSDSQLINEVFHKLGEEIRKDTLSRELVNQVSFADAGKKVTVNGEELMLALEE